MQERRALGKGLSSLIPSMGGSRNDSSNKNYMELDLEDIIPNKEQPRKLFNKESIDELANSIAEKGILQPLLVRKMGGGKYELIAGERRLRAAKQIHLERVPVVIKDIDSNESLEIALIENIQRENLNPIEEALAYKDLIGKFQYTQDELAKKLGKDRSSIANTMRLLKLPEEIRSHIINGTISMGHARALVTIDNRELQTSIADEIIANSLSVRDVEKLLQKMRSDDDGDSPAETKKGVLASVAKSAGVVFRNLEDELKKILKTQIQIKGKEAKGKIILHYSSLDEFNRLYDCLKK